MYCIYANQFQPKHYHYMASTKVKIVSKLAQHHDSNTSSLGNGRTTLDANWNFGKRSGLPKNRTVLLHSSQPALGTIHLLERMICSCLITSKSSRRERFQKAIKFTAQLREILAQQ
ncbi:hypothetical protein G6F54_013951 [Rhizopus delemar]|nr:hypothetical protein G6F54_013951 [Rhizopus delemar]